MGSKVMSAVPKFLRNPVNDLVRTASFGTVDAKKGRVFVPFSSGQMRNWAKGIGQGSSIKAVEKGLDTKEARITGTVLGSIGGAAAGAGVAGAIGGGAAAAGGAGGSAGAGTGTASGLTLGNVGTGASIAALGASLAAPALNKPPDIPTLDFEGERRKADKAARDVANGVASREAEERRERRAKRAQTVLTGTQGLGGSSPSFAPTLQPTQPRKSVLG